MAAKTFDLAFLVAGILMEPLPCCRTFTVTRGTSCSRQTPSERFEIGCGPSQR
jgi:hypothetical protein